MLSSLLWNTKNLPPAKWQWTLNGRWDEITCRVPTAPSWFHRWMQRDSSRHSLETNLMPEYLRHPNGRGKLFDDAEANRGTFIDRTSSASGSAKLRDCELFHCSLAKDNCQIYGGRFQRSIIAGKTVVAGSPVVISSILDCSEVSGTPHLHTVVAIDGTEICDSPTLEGSFAAPLVLSGATIYGNPTIVGGLTITGRVHEGTWTRAPKHIKLPWCDLTECIDGKLLLDCRCRTIAYWLRHGAKLAKRWDWSEDMIAVTLETIEKEFPPPRFVADGETVCYAISATGDPKCQSCADSYSTNG